MISPRYSSSVLLTLALATLPSRGESAGCKYADSHMDMNQVSMPQVCNDGTPYTKSTDPSLSAPQPAAAHSMFSAMSLSGNPPVPVQQPVAPPSNISQPQNATVPPVVTAPPEQGANAQAWQVWGDQLKKNYDDEAGVVDKFVQLASNPTDKDAKPILPSDVNMTLMNKYLGDEDAMLDAFKNSFPKGDHIHSQIVEAWKSATPGDAVSLQNRINWILQNSAGTDLNGIEADPRFKSLSGSINALSQDMIDVMGKENKNWATPLMGADSLSTAIMNREAQDQHNTNAQNTSPDSPAPFLFSGQEALEQGNTQGAINDLSKAVQLDQSDEKALSMLSEADYMKGDYPAAASAAQAALQLNPNDDKMQNILGLTQNRLASGSTGALGEAGNLGGSAGVAATLGNPLMVSGQGQSGPAVRDAQTAMRVGDFALGITRLTQAIALDPQNAQAYDLRAIAFNRTHQYDLALQDAVAGLKLAPKSVALLLAKAVALNKLHRYAEAEAAARAALSVDPNSAQAYNALAEALAGQHRNPEAIAALRAAAHIDPRFNGKLQQAIQLPPDSDLAFLFPDDDAVGSAKKNATGAAAPLSGRFKAVAGACLLGGLLLALGAFKLFMPREKTSRASVRGVPPSDRNGNSPGLLRGKYRVGRQIGAGGMGLVYDGEDVSLRRRVAIKKMREEIRANPRERARFVTEAKVVAGLHHPGVVDIYSIVERDEDVFLVFEYVSGKTLHDIVHGDGSLSFGKALGIIKSAGEAIDFAHSRGIIHRDLKPSNIMLTDENRVKVMDFGIARLAKDAMAQFSQTNTVMGTPPYMAPEQEQGIVRRESDVYALAVCLYEMLTGGIPFNGSGAGMLMNKMDKKYIPASKLAPALPPGVDEVFARAFQPDPEKRFHSAKELVGALDSLSLKIARA